MRQSISTIISQTPLPFLDIRWLKASDEASLIELLQDCYGNSYSYQNLYSAGGFSGLWNAGQLISLGGYDLQGNLYAHTGFWLKDLGQDYLESGLSFVRPRSKSKIDYPRLWGYLQKILAPHFAFIYQNTTTLHPFAQWHAQRYMAAKPTGLIFFYTEKEKLKGFRRLADTMHALTMTTCLRTKEKQKSLVPSGKWGDWLTLLIKDFDEEMLIEELRLTESSEPEGITLESIEENSSLSLRRRRMKEGSSLIEGLLSINRANKSNRVELIHVPQKKNLLAQCGALFANDYLPVGFCPHHDSPDELVFQHLPQKNLREERKKIKCSGPKTRKIVESWFACADT